jgi:hypothetical protein
MLRETPIEILNPVPLITGDDLAELGVAQGPIYKKLLDGVREAQLEGTIGSKDEAIEVVKRLLGEWDDHD